MNQSPQPERRSYKFDWRMFLGMFVMLVGQGLFQSGVTRTEIQEIARRMERVEQKIDDKMLPREEFEKRHEDMRREVEELRERVQTLELESIGKKK